MILLVSGGTRTVSRLINHPNLGVLLTPAAGNATPPRGVTYAADNSAFSNRGRGFDDAQFRAMLARLHIENRRDARWVAAPDVVGDHAATLELWRKYLPVLAAYDQPAAFVAQDGATAESLPWDGIAAVFIGGTTRWKLGTEAARIVHEARRRGLWTHMGRVNTFRRLIYAQTLGVDSVDGSKFSRFSETYIPTTLDFLAQLDRQQMLTLPSAHI
jgi:hypothetical protein